MKTEEGDTLLHRATLAGASKLVARFVAMGAQVDANGVDGLTPHHCAVSRGHKDVAEFLLAKGADPNSRDDEEGMPLHTAAGEGYKDIVELLLPRELTLILRINGAGHHFISPACEDAETWQN